MKKIINKKGAGHVEVILSFVIFISLIIFILIVFKPLKMFSKTSSSDLNVIESEILEKISTELSIVAIRLNESLDADVGDCYYFEDSDNLTEENVILKDTKGIGIESKKQNNNIYFKYSGDNFTRIYSSEEFEQDDFDINGCDLLKDEDYALGIVRKSDIVAMSKLESLNTSYYGDYEQLKQEIGLKNDFNFVVVNISDNKILFLGERNKPQGIEVRAGERIIEILDSPGNLNTAKISIQIW